MNKMLLITMPKLNRALYRVDGELERLDVFTEDVYEVDVYLVPMHPVGLVAHGWKYVGRKGSITIPAVSLPRLSHLFGAPYVSLAEVLRHEYGHAIADLYPRLTRSRRFHQAFGAGYDSGEGSPYDPEEHVSPYAATQPAEDFAETFAIFVRRQGSLPGNYDSMSIRRKWSFIGEMCEVISAGGRTW